MPDMVRTPEGRLWYLQNDKDLEELIRRYAGDEAAEVVRHLQERDTYEEERAHTDADVYEEELNELIQASGGWSDELETIAAMAEDRRVTKAMLATAIRGVVKNINNTI